jgi:8-oxo-dGTP pyrophosphatase MutT (NUDIX family)
VSVKGLRLCRPGDPTPDLALTPGPGSLAEARAHITAAHAPDATATAYRERMLAFVDAHPDVLRRDCPEAHLTGSAMVVNPAERRFLLMLHAKLGRWFQPGGHADGDGALPRVAWREATEETGIERLRLAVPAIDLDIHEVGPPHGPHLHLDVRYLVIAPPDAVPAGNHESLDLRWATYDELPDFDVDVGVLRMARAALGAIDALDPVTRPSV